MSASESTGQLDRPSWKMRRIAIFGWLILCAVAVGFLLLWGDPSNAIHSKALTWSFATGIITVFGYAGWATFEDVELSKIFGIRS